MIRNLSRRDFLVAVAAAASATGVRAQTGVPSLKDACRGVFLIGTAFDFRTPTEFTPAEISFIKAQFNAITPENSMKPGPVHPQEQTWNSHDKVTLIIETLDERKSIGIVALRDADPINARAKVDIYIGEPEFWGGGYGTDALRRVCRYGFDTMRLHSIELTVVEANERAIKSYKKLGFQVDGRLRQAFHRDGEWHDELLMCVLKDELT